MTFTIKTRGAGSLVSAEYRCPEHGVFGVLARRDANGDAPDEQPCPEIGEHDSSCDTAFEEACSGEEGCAPCGIASPWTISASHQRVKSVVPTAAIRGGDMKDRPPGMLDTRDLGEGKVTLTEWKKAQREQTRRNRYDQLISKGVLQKKIQVG
jgi:hypothetical protein